MKTLRKRRQEIWYHESVKDEFTKILNSLFNNVLESVFSIEGRILDFVRS